MHSIKLTKDHRVFLDDMEVEGVLGVEFRVEALKDPEVVLRVSVKDFDVDDYRDYWYKN